MNMNDKKQFATEIFGIKFHFSQSKVIREREIHDYHELLYYLDGNASLRTETYSIKLKARSLIFIPKGKYHFFSPENPEKFTRLKISFSDGVITDNLPASLFQQVKIIEEPDQTVRALFNSVISKLQTASSQKNPLYFYGAFLTSIAGLSVGEETQSENCYSQPILDCIEFIEDNLSGDLSIEELSKVVSFSPSALSHSFKMQTGVSLHSYVAQKRLIYAKSLLDLGEKPTEIYLKLGYKDYSSFYKAYKKMFGKCPKN